MKVCFHHVLDEFPELEAPRKQMIILISQLPHYNDYNLREYIHYLTDRLDGNDYLFTKVWYIRCINI